MIMEKCADLLPDYFSFVRGLVDSARISSLNISREMLQHDRQLKLIAGRTRKEDQVRAANPCSINEREKYEQFYTQLRPAAQVRRLSPTTACTRSCCRICCCSIPLQEKKLVTFKEYISRMKEDQKYIYYACGESVEPHRSACRRRRRCKEKGYEILYLTDDVDEFALRMMHDYGG